MKSAKNAKPGSAFFKKLEAVLKGGVSIVVKGSSDSSSDCIIANFLLKNAQNDGIYVNLSKPFYTLQSELIASNVDMLRLFFVNGTGRSILGQAAHNCVFIDDFRSIDQLSLCIDSLVSHGSFDFLYIDSLSELPAHNKKEDVEAFLKYLTDKIENNELKNVVLSTNKIKDANAFFLVSKDVKAVEL